jgi:hypothetical protein
MDIKKTLQDILDQTHSSTKKQTIKSTKDGYNFACPVCGDSDKDLDKKRAWILTKKETPYFYCHHECGGMSMSNFLKKFNLTWKQETSDIFDDFMGPLATETKKKYKYDPKVKALEEIDRLSVNLRDVMMAFGIVSVKPDSSAYQYLESRNLTHLSHYFGYQPKWKRLIIFNTLEEPMLARRYNEEGEWLEITAKVIGFQARAINDNTPKYLTYTLEKIRGKCELKYNPKPGCEDYVKLLTDTYFSTQTRPHDDIFVLEGPIDALLVDNGIAITGASKVNKHLSRSDRAHYIFDNDKTGRKAQTDQYKYWSNSTKIFDWQGICKLVKHDGIKDINDLHSHCQSNSIDMPNLKDYLL